MSVTVYDIWLSLHLKSEDPMLPDLLSIFGDAFGIYNADEDEIRHACGPHRGADRLGNRDLTKATEILRFCERCNIGLIRINDRGYPKKLAETEGAPYLLYVAGTLPDMDDSFGIGIVGTRSMSRYGMEQAYRFSYELASAGAVVVSGMAKGIDGVAAVSAIEAGGKTVAVMGTGINVPYPPEHADLFREITRHGAVITEYPPDAGFDRNHFPARNRIISGLSDGVLVVEAGYASGACITARRAWEQGRRVFAVPGRLGDYRALGSNNLIKKGAGFVTGAGDILASFEDTESEHINANSYAASVSYSKCRTDILEDYGVFVPSEEASKPSKPAKPTVKKDISVKITHEKEPPEGKLRDLWLRIPDGVNVSADYFLPFGFSVNEAMNLLSMLEISGFVRSVPGGAYTKS